MAEKRPYFKLGTDELEALFQEIKKDPEKLAVLKQELEHRSRPRAKKLLARVNDLIGPERHLLLPLSPPQPIPTDKPSKKRKKTTKEPSESAKTTAAPESKPATKRRKQTKEQSDTSGAGSKPKTKPEKPATAKRLKEQQEPAEKSVEQPEAGQPKRVCRINLEKKPPAPLKPKPAKRGLLQLLAGLFGANES